MDAEEFTDRFKSLLENIHYLSLAEKQDKICDLFLSSHHSLFAIIEAVVKSNEILVYARQDFLEDFWRWHLVENQILFGFGGGENEPLRSQPGVKDVDIILGFGCFKLWVDCESSESVSLEEKLALLKKGVSFHSWHCTNALIEYYLNSDPVSYLKELKALLEEVKIHGTPGYLLLGSCYGRAFENTNKYDLKYKSVLFFYTACELEIHSEHSIHNSCFGDRESAYPDPVGGLFQTTDELCENANIDDYMRYRIKQEARQEAEIYLEKYLKPASSSISISL